MKRIPEWVGRWLLAAIFLVATGPTCVLGSVVERRVLGVRYVGVGAISSRELDDAVSVAPGDPWREDMIPTTRKVVAEYYARRGFFQAKVEVHSVPAQNNNLALVVRVDEGPPCVIKSLWIDDPPGFKSKHVMQHFKDKMTDILKTRVGDRYDEQTLADRLREVREWLIDEDYILANTDKVRLSFNDAHTEVGVVAAIDYGDRVTFGFQGNTVLTQAELTDLIAQIRATGLGKDYVGVIERRFADEYHSKAYNNVRIESRFSELPLSKHVTFVFTEGARTELEEVRWEGLGEKNAAQAREVFENGSSRLVQRGFLVEKDVDKAVLLVLEDLKSRGYLSSKLISKSVQAVKAPRNQQRARVVVQIAEGEQTTVGKVELNGFTYFGEEKIRSTLSTSDEKPFNPFALEEGLQRLRALYIYEGFLEFRILTPEDQIVSFAENTRSARIHLRVYEGPRVKIGQIRIEGLQKTREYVVARELLVHEDDWWLGGELQQTETNIRKLGLFSEVKLVPVPSLKGPGHRDLVVNLKEAEPGSLEAGPGFRSDLGIRAFSRLSYNNIFGKNWIGSLGAEANRRVNNDYRFVEYQFDTTFVEPRFFGTHNLYTIGLSTKKQRFPPDFNAVSTTFITGFERKLIPQITTKLLYKLERIRQFDVFFQNSFSAIDNRSMLIGSINPSIALDTRDNPFTTANGWLSNVALEYAQPGLSGQNVADSNAPSYQKWTGSIHRYTSVFKDVVWSNVVSGGFARSNVSGREIPLIKLFRLGGYSTIRGFPEDAINVDTIKIAGTLTFFNLRTQIDLPLVGDLKFAPFVDAGNLYIDQLRNNPFFRAGAGVGLHYMTPVGPINLDWGHKLNPIGGEAPNQIHFSVGLI
ncbi:MAG: BamA/TamA family outer membrane protein [Deltaproteobacteria bacterium]|nr:BamA/TamA family outer membrane protein [Deltaproteobacteria bacterium]